MAYQQPFGASTSRSQQQQTTVPSLPQYNVPGAGRPLAQQSDFWKANPYVNPYDDFEANLGAQDYLNIGKQANPFAGGWDKAKATISSAYPDMTDPETIKQLQAYMAPLEGGMARTLRSAQQDLESVVGLRGGYGVGSGQAPGGGYAKQALDSIAAQYGGNYEKAMTWLMGKAKYDLEAQQLLASLLQTYMGTGTALSAQQLQALQSGAAGKENYLKAASTAYNLDVNQYNQALQSNWDTTQRIAAETAADEQKKRINQMIEQVSTSGIRPYEEGQNPLANIMTYLIMTGKINNPMMGKKVGTAPNTAATYQSGASQDSVNRANEEAIRELIKAQTGNYPG